MDTFDLICLVALVSLGVGVLAIACGLAIICSRPRKSPELRYLSVVVFDPQYKWNWSKEDIQPGEQVIYLGEIPNVPGHGCVLRESGEIAQHIHPSDYREATEEEV